MAPPAPLDHPPPLPSVKSRALAFTLRLSLTNCTLMLLLAAVWHEALPIADPVLRGLSSLVLLSVPFALARLLIPRFVQVLLRPILKIADEIEKVALGRMEIDLPEPRVREVARVNSALAVMIRRLRTSLLQLEKSAQEDSLTQLSNRPHFKSRVEQELQSNNGAAILLMDLDRFKSVNDSIGHAGGDRLLALFAERLRIVLNKYGSNSRADQTPIAARLGGDEFAICLSGMTDATMVAHVAQRLLKAVEDPFSIDGSTINISISIGIALAPQDGESCDLLLRNADLALFKAKQLGKKNYQFFNESLKRQALARLTIETQLRAAIEADSFRVYFQPLVCARTQKVICAEALVRWQHSKLGLLLPSKFINVAEECGLIAQIGQIVLRLSIAQAALWHKQGRPLRVSVNVAAVQLRQKDFIEQLRRLLADHDLPPWLLELELTETTAMQDTQDVRQQLADLRAMGVSLAIDDFGTGYSNLGLLRRLEFDRLKIDRSFISGIETQEDARMIVSTILAMAHAMDVEVVAEGVETSRQATILQSAGCTLLQGFYFSRPMPVHDFETWWSLQEPVDATSQTRAQVA